MLIAKEKVGFIQRFYEDEASATGYTVEYLIGDEIKAFPCTKEYWDFKDREEFIFPLITENCRVMEYDENGYACGSKTCEGGKEYYGAYRVGCPRGFGAIYRIEGNKLIIDGKKFNEFYDADIIAHYNDYFSGNFKPIPREDLVFELADDLGIYCLDFYGGERCQHKRSMWYLKDVLKNNKNCYWMNLFDYFNGEGKIDMIVLFRQPPKGPEATGGNLAKLTLTGAQRFEGATGSCYEDEADYY